MTLWRIFSQLNVNDTIICKKKNQVGSHWLNRWLHTWRFNDLSEVYHDPWGTPMETQSFTGLFENCCISGEKVTLTKHPWGAKSRAWTCLGTVELGFKSMFNWLQSFFFFFFLFIPQKTVYCLFAWSYFRKFFIVTVRSPSVMQDFNLQFSEV